MPVDTFWAIWAIPEPAIKSLFNSLQKEFTNLKKSCHSISTSPIVSLFYCFNIACSVSTLNVHVAKKSNPHQNTGFVQKIVTIFPGLFKDYSRTELNFQGPPTREVI